MKIGLYAHTHGVSYRDAQNKFVKSIPATTTRPVEVAQWAERAGFHSMWFPDHVCMPLSSTSGHVVNESRTRGYEPRHEMLDGAVVMGAVAAATSRLRLGTSVLIAPYRGPLNDARQLATIDVLFGRSAHRRGRGGLDGGGVRRTRRSLRGARREDRRMHRDLQEGVVRRGRLLHGSARSDSPTLSMDPKPMQKPRPPIVYGGVTAGGAKAGGAFVRRPVPALPRPGGGSVPLRPPAGTSVRRELEALRRDPGSFLMLAATSMRITDAADPAASSSQRRPLCTGTPKQVLEDLARFAAAGYSLVICAFDCPSHTVTELCEQIDRAGREILSAAADIAPQGGWRPVE